MRQCNQKGRGITRHAFVNTRMRGKLDIDIEEKGSYGRGRKGRSCSVRQGPGGLFERRRSRPTRDLWNKGGSCHLNRRETMGRTGSGRKNEETTAIDIDSAGHLCSCRQDFPFGKLLLPKLPPLSASLAQALYPSPQMPRLCVNLPHSNLTSLPRTHF